MVDRKRFWKEKKVLVTGFEGFVGSHLTKALTGYGARVTGLDIKTLRKETILCPDDYKRIKVYQGSVASGAFVRGILRKHPPQVIFHLAAESIVGRSRENPLAAFTSNIAGSWEILDACRELPGLQALIVASSDKAYGAGKKLPYLETDPLLANHPYDVSKSCADLIAGTYAHTYGLPVTIIRCGNIYGPGDFNFSRLIPDALRCRVKGNILPVRSDGKYVRDYVYISDIIDGYLRAAELFKRKRLCGEAFNLSDQRPVTVIQLLQKINRLNLCTRPLKYKIMNTAKYEIRRQYLSAHKAGRVLGWRPVYDLEHGLKAAAQWYFNYFSSKS